MMMGENREAFEGRALEGATTGSPRGGSSSSRGDGGGDGDDAVLLLDFRTAFAGSVFERWHVRPVHIAYLNRSRCDCTWLDEAEMSKCLKDYLLQEQESANLLRKRKYKAFVSQFLDYCRSSDDCCFLALKGETLEDSLLRIGETVEAFLAKSWTSAHQHDDDDDDDDDDERRRLTGIRSDGRASTMIPDCRAEGKMMRRAFGRSWKLIYDDYGYEYHPRYDYDCGDGDGERVRDDKDDDCLLDDDDDDGILKKVPSEGEGECDGDGRTSSVTVTTAMAMAMAFQDQFVGFLVHENMPRLVQAKAFGRFGEIDDDERESDAMITKLLFDYGNAEVGLYCEGEEFSRVELIDFDLVGSDGQGFPLRMFMWEGLAGRCGWLAVVQDRATCLPIVRATHGYGQETTEIRILREDVFQQRYKPHGDIPGPRLRSLSWLHWMDTDPDFQFSSDDWCLKGGGGGEEEEERESLKTTGGGGGGGGGGEQDKTKKGGFGKEGEEEGEGSLKNKKEEDEEEEAEAEEREEGGGGVPRGGLSVGPEEIPILRNLYGTYLEFSLVYFTSRSEMERLIPVVASLTLLCEAGADGFDEYVAKYKLRVSSLRDAREFEWKHFLSVFRGSMWETLPKELIMHIVRFLPDRRFLFRPTAGST